MKKNIIKRVKVVSNIEEIKNKTKKLAELLNEANSIIAELAEKGIEAEIEVGEAQHEQHKIPSCESLN